MQEARSFHEWWNAICRMAEDMEFQQVVLSMDGNGRGDMDLHWDRPGPTLPGDRLLNMVMPVRETDPAAKAELKVAIGINGSLEASGRRAALFGRLIDEHKPPRPEGQKPAIPLGGQP